MCAPSFDVESVTSTSDDHRDQRGDPAVCVAEPSGPGTTRRHDGGGEPHDDQEDRDDVRHVLAHSFSFAASLGLDSTLPSRIRTIRSAASATSMLCVTMMIV